MADRQQNPGMVSNSFTKGMVKDLNDLFIGEGNWTHARNAVNNSYDGQMGVIGNEPANLHCVTLPYTLIGCIHLTDDQWAVFTTDDTNSEIGIFDESACTYSTVVNATCLNFKKANLITGAFRQRFDCERRIYWDDGLNPSRFMDLEDPPYKVNTEIVNSCKIETVIEPKQLDCEKIRLAPLIIQPCLELSAGNGAGNLLNGSYQVCAAYTIDQVRVTDYMGLSNVQGIFDHDNARGSLDIEVKEIDKTFDEFELVILAQINGSTVAKKLGIYSTNQSRIFVDILSNELITVPITDIVVRREPVEKSDALYTVNNYLLRVGVYSKYKFNYQQQANKIRTRWVAVEYPSDYYVKKKSNTGYMRDEQYPFFIRWVYNTGEYSESYHIPGRTALPKDQDNLYNEDAFEAKDGKAPKRWTVYNTATTERITTSTLDDGGLVVAAGSMGYWESSELYPDNLPEIWGDLCGKPIRHHKFPDETVSQKLNIYNNGKIVILGVQFENITHPLDQNGKPIESIVGYQILRGSRQGNKTVVAKGMFNNMREYDIPGVTQTNPIRNLSNVLRDINNPGSANNNLRGLYQNYPYNDLGADDYLTSSEQTGTNGTAKVKSKGLTKYRQDVFSFHSPETTFTNPFINSSEMKIYSNLIGTSTGRFITPYKHPKFKVLTDFTKILTKVLAVVGSLSKLAAVLGGTDLKFEADEKTPVSFSMGANPNPAGDTASGGVSVLGTGGSVTVSPLTIAQFATAAATNIALLGALTVTGILPRMYDQQYTRLFLYLIPKIQYALQYVSHAFYNTAKPVKVSNTRRKVINTSYVSQDVQSFGTEFLVNNINRGSFIAVQIPSNTRLSDPSVKDDSRFLISDKKGKLNTNYSSTVSSYYGALKVSLANQYGQLDSIKQIPVSTCVEATEPDAGKKFTSPVLFGGDIYINRFTEKNSMLFFNTWMMGEPDETEFDYTAYAALPYPRFWINNVPEHAEFLKTANDYRVLDYRDSAKFHVKRGYFYLFNSGVRDFFVESEVNLAYRDWEDGVPKRHYDPNRFTDLNTMFRSDYIKEPNYYRYDYSLSISKLFNSQISWANILPRDYDPAKASTCFTYYPNRVIYSLPQQDMSKKDNWRVNLANNYKDFLNPVTSIKSVNKTGALFMMARQSPLMFMGVEELRLDGTGAKITIGDGALFSGPQQLQSLVNADESYEYGSCQGRYATLSCVHGVFWVSQDQGKVFQYAGGVNEISRDGLKWWFAKYLPSDLIKMYPTYPLRDNPVKGIGVQLIYDNTNEIVYITKKDYKPKFNDFLMDGDRFYRIVEGVRTYYELTDTTAFENASWTISYDPKSKAWLSYHDWIPSFLIPGKAHFMSVNIDSIWKHNTRVDKYCNFYNQDYPFEVEFVSATGQSVTAMRSIEYQLESYKTYNEGRDKYHILDHNFDQAMIYNSEQVSGILELRLKEKNNPISMLNYPKINNQSIEILYAKEENKYRINQFWDITNDRGEFSGKENPLFRTEPNGYIFNINNTSVDYKKASFERKKFRHTANKVLLRKLVSQDVKMLFKLSNQKINPSPR
jgi:hypothetical protein